jgi:hypothetical protein
MDMFAFEYSEELEQESVTKLEPLSLSSWKLIFGKMMAALSSWK